MPAHAYLVVLILKILFHARKYSYKIHASNSVVSLPHVTLHAMEFPIIIDLTNF